MKHKILLGLFIILNQVILHAQPACPQGTEKSNYGFINPCSSFMKWEVKPKHLGSIFKFDEDNLLKNSFCIYSTTPYTEYFDGKIELVNHVRFPIKDRKNLVVNLTPCKVNRFYVKNNFHYRFQNWESEIGTYSGAKWSIEHLKNPPRKVDSIFFLNARKPSFGEYMALLYLELNSEVDFDIPKISEFLTGDKKYMREFYEDVIGKPYGDLNTSLREDEPENIKFTPALITNEYVNVYKGYAYFSATSFFFDSFYKKYGKQMHPQNTEELIIKVYDFLNPPSRFRSYPFHPQYLIDKYYGSLRFGFEDEIIGLDITNPNIKDTFNNKKSLSAVIRADFDYDNLPYERITIKNAKPIALDSFYTGKGLLKIKPIKYIFDLDLFGNDENIGFVSSFHQQILKSKLPFRINSDEYIKSFMGLYIENAKISIVLDRQDYNFEDASLLIDGTEINGVVNVDFTKFKRSMNAKKLIRLFKSKGIEAQIPNEEENSTMVQLFFRIQ